MDLVAIVAVVLGSAGITGAAGAATQWTRRARLRSSIEKNLALAKEFPQPSAARGALQNAAEHDAVALAVLTLHPTLLRQLAGCLTALGLSSLLIAVTLSSELPTTEVPQIPTPVLKGVITGAFITSAVLAAVLGGLTVVIWNKRADHEEDILKSAGPTTWPPDLAPSAAPTPALTPRRGFFRRRAG